MYIVYILYIEGAGAKLSSVFWTGYSASKVIDGIYAPALHNEQESMAHSFNETSPWIQIDLFNSSCISAVKIWNRCLSSPGNYINTVRETNDLCIQFTL